MFKVERIIANIGSTNYTNFGTKTQIIKSLEVSNLKGASVNVTVSRGKGGGGGIVSKVIIPLSGYAYFVIFEGLTTSLAVGDYIAISTSGDVVACLNLVEF